MSKGVVKSVRETVEILVVALILAFFIRTFVVQAFKIPSGSMLETLQIGDHLLVSKFLYGIKMPFTDQLLIPVTDPERGDIIVFKYPMDPSIDFIKRVVAIPGDVVEIRAKQLYVNGVLDKNPHAQFKDSTIYPKAAHFPDALEPEQFESYFNGVGQMSKRDNLPALTVPAGQYFVMGDNRDGSHDSRFWGFVDRSAIAGKAFLIHWSWVSLTDVRWNRIGTLIR